MTWNNTTGFAFTLIMQAVFIDTSLKCGCSKSCVCNKRRSLLTKFSNAFFAFGSICSGERFLKFSIIFTANEIMKLPLFESDKIVLHYVCDLKDGVHSIALPLFTIERQRKHETMFFFN